MLRHCTIQELLDVRSGEGSYGARTHVDECQECRDELDRLHQRVASLKALRAVMPPRDRWPVVREQAMVARRRTWWIRSGWAAAAAVAFLVGGGVLMNGPAHAPDPTERELIVLERQAQELELVLRRLDEDRRVINGLTALAIADLEDRIILLDTHISSARRAAVSYRELTDLYRQRVVLMDALVNTHVQRAAYLGF